MSGRRRITVRVLVAATLALVLVAGLLPGRLEVATRIYALLVAGVALWLVLSALRRAYPPAASLSRAAGRRRAAPDRQMPPTLHRLEQACVLGAARSFDFHYRLRPRLREIAAVRLLARRGIVLDAGPEAARRALGDGPWELLRADRRPPEDRLAPGIASSELRSLVESLESL